MASSLKCADRCWKTLWLRAHEWAEHFDYALTNNETVDRCTRCRKIKYRPYRGGGTC